MERKTEWIDNVEKCGGGVELYPLSIGAERSVFRSVALPRMKLSSFTFGIDLVSVCSMKGVATLAHVFRRLWP